jgi:hypothetical protein
VVIDGLLGLMSIAVSLGGLSADPPAPSAWVGMINGIANFAVVGLLLAPATAQDSAGKRGLGPCVWHRRMAQQESSDAQMWAAE